jgi:hypothetical protein
VQLAQKTSKPVIPRPGLSAEESAFSPTAAQQIPPAIMAALCAPSPLTSNPAPENRMFSVISADDIMNTAI